MNPQTDWSEFDAKFPFRIYGIAGEPKTEFVTAVNLPDKIKAHIEQQEKEWLERAALSAETGMVLAVGLMDESGKFKVIEGDERTIVEMILTELTSRLDLSYEIVGFNIFGFDLPFLIRRAWMLGLKPPALRDRYWRTGLVDLMDKWTCGNREQRISLDSLAKALRVGAKTGSGADFAALWATDKAKALAYLENDLTLTRLCAERML